MATQSIHNKSNAMHSPVEVDVNIKIPGIRFIVDRTWGSMLRKQKRIFLSKRTMELIDPKTGLMECRICGSRHFALMPPVGGNEDVGITGYKRGSWQCVNGCRMDVSEGPSQKRPPTILPG